MDELPSNSHASKEKEGKAKGDAAKEKPEKAKVEAVVKGEVVIKKPPIMTRIKETFFGGDFAMVARYIGSDVLLPAIRSLVVETATKGIEKAIYGDVTPRRRSAIGGAPKYRYDTPMRRQPEERAPARSYSGGDRRPTSVNDILVSRKEDADMVIDTLVEIVEQYGRASVSELFELLGQPSNYTETKWGWYELPYARVVQSRNGWLLDLPPVHPLD